MARSLAHGFQPAHSARCPGANGAQAFVQKDNGRQAGRTVDLYDFQLAAQNVGEVHVNHVNHVKRRLLKAAPLARVHASVFAATACRPGTL